LFAFSRKKKLPYGERRRNHIDKRGKERCKRKEGPAKGDKRRKTKIGPKMRIEKSKGRVNAKKKTEKKTKKKKGGDGERFHEESGWLTDDLIKRGTNYRPAGC